MQKDLLSCVRQRVYLQGIWQCAGYINGIEGRRNLPSMSAFFYICEYLGVTSGDFFDFDSKAPGQPGELVCVLKKLDERQLAHLTGIAKDMAR